MTRRCLPASIQTRLTLWYTAVLLVILLLVGGISYSLLRSAIVQDVDRSVLALAEGIRAAYASAHGGPGVEAALAGVDPDVADHVFQVVDVDGTPRYRSPRLRGKTLPVPLAAREGARRGTPTFETVRVAHRTWRVVTVPVDPVRRPSELVQAAVSLSMTEHALARYLETLVVLVPLGLGLAALGGALMARKALAPVDAMSTDARRIGAEDLSRRLPLRGTGDELDRLAETLNDMLARLGGAFTELQRFSADAAHELRTPLTALKGGLEVALRARRSAEEYRQVLAASLDDVERLIRLAEDLLMVARSSAEAAVSRTPVDLDQVALEVVDVGARIGRARAVTVRIEVGDPVRVLGDAVLLRRAALNLMENAVKYTPAGGHVELSVGRDDGSGVLSVRDTGPGIPAEDAARIFEPFVRLDAARDREHGGAGLGLSIARSIVAAHGGSLALESAAGGGARFTMRLPAAG